MTPMESAQLSPFPLPEDALAYQAKERRTSEAVIFPQAGQRMTYGDWYERARNLACGLVDLGFRPGDHIAILAESRIEWPVAQMAIAMMGGVMVPLNTHYRRDDLRYALSQSRTKCLFLSTEFRGNRYLETVLALLPELEHLRTLVPFDERDAHSYDDLIARGTRSDTELPRVSPDSIASLQYTSGTTGFPKGALLTHAGMLANAWGISGRLKVSERDRWTSIIPLFHCAGCIMCILGTLQRGACYVGAPAFDPRATFELVETEKCTLLSGVPTSHIAMLEHPDREKYDLSTLRAGTCGGADTDPALLRECARAFPLPGVVQVYGQTEASTLISLADCEAPERFETCGPPLPGAEVRIADPATGKELPAGEIGQIETCGPMVMRGYFDNPDATRETIGEDGWMRTGDLGYLTPDGNIVVAGGRLRDMIIRGGENVYPVEIENTLRAHPAVSDIAAFGLPDRYYGETVAAAVSLVADVSAEELRRYCGSRIARFKLPARFYRVEAFPLTASGKIRKTELQELARADRLKLLQ